MAEKSKREVETALEEKNCKVPDVELEQFKSALIDLGLYMIDEIKNRKVQKPQEYCQSLVDIYNAIKE